MAGPPWPYRYVHPSAPVGRRQYRHMFFGQC